VSETSQKKHSAAYVYSFGRLKRLVAAPRFAPKPVLRQGVDSQLVLQVIWKILIETRVAVSLENAFGGRGGESKRESACARVREQVWYLVQISQTVGVLRQLLVVLPNDVASSVAAEQLQVNNIEGGDVVRLAS
jgi:hypothetical protein